MATVIDAWTALVHYITEQTGLPAGVVQRVLDAQNRFWDEHPHLLDEIAAEADDDEAPA